MKIVLLVYTLVLLLLCVLGSSSPLGLSPKLGLWMSARERRELLKRLHSGLLLTLVFVGLFTSAFGLQSVNAESGTIIVPDDYSSIQEAIDHAGDRDTVFVRTGIYYEAVVLKENVSLVGEDRDGTVIDGNGAKTVVKLNSNSNISGFTIRNGEYGVQVQSWAFVPEFTGNRIECNLIANNQFGAIVLKGCANNTISNNIIANNTLFGIHLLHAGKNTIINNTILNNGHGIAFHGNSNDNILRSNNMTDNDYNFGLILRGQTRDWLVAGNRHGIINDVDTSNTVNGKPIVYWINQHDKEVPSDAGFVWLTDCNNIIVNNLNLSNNLQGILLLWTNNTVIMNNNITGNVYGIYVTLFSNNNTIIGNTVKDNLNGIYVGDLSSLTTMRGNNITGGHMNFGVAPDIGRYFVGRYFGPWIELMNDVDTSNTVDGKPIVYWINQHYRKVPTNAGYVMLINSTNILIEGLNLSNNVQNIFLIATNNTVIAENLISNSIYGICIRHYGWFDYSTMTQHTFYSFNTTINGNMFADNGVGITMGSNNSIVSNNTLHRNPLGICTTHSSYSVISKNTIIESDLDRASQHPDLLIFYYPEEPWERSRELIQLQIGGLIVGGQQNVIYGNTVMNSAIGILMGDQIQNFMGVNNLIYHNNFLHNRQHQAFEPHRGSNNWDAGYPVGGNYWSDYICEDNYRGPNQDEPGSDGIGDTPHPVACTQPPSNQDHYPLMEPVVPPPLGEQIGVKTGDWIKYVYTITGAPPDTPLPNWMKVEFLSVQEATATICVTMHMSDGTEQNETMVLDIVTGSGTSTSFSGFVIPANCTAKDFIYISGYGNITIIGETIEIYAGANRRVVYTSLSQHGVELTYCWDKQTGVMVEASVISGNMTATAKATETNMWPAQPSLVGDLDNDGKVDIQDLYEAALAFGSYPGHPRWNPIADINKDDKTNIIDIVLIAKNFVK